MFSRTNRPDLHTSRFAWESSWQQDLDKAYRTSALALLPVTLAGIIPAGRVTTWNSDGHLLTLQKEQQAICALQKDLMTIALMLFAEEDFENKWLGLTGEKRREFVMEGIYRTMRISGMEDRRQWCPDSTLAHLTSDNGKTYLNMLKGLLPEDLHTPLTEPTQIPHPVVDRFFSLSASDLNKPGMKTMIRTYRQGRIYCLSATLWNILLVCEGKDEPQITVKPPRAGRRERDMSPERAEYAKLYRKLMHDVPYVCSRCEKNEKQLAPGEKLMSCTKCRKIDRRVLYCSRECQVEDWKHGKPYAHKLICGKLLDEEMFGSILAARSKEVEDEASKTRAVPSPDSTFQRSPALVHQIALVTERPDVDYALMRSFPDSTRAICFPDPLEKTHFRARRIEAFRTGDPPVVRELFRMMKEMLQAKFVNFPIVDLRRQMENEFGVTLDDE